MINEYNREIMSNLKEELKCILTLVPKESDIVYLEYPVHSNIGDMIIMKGTEQFFKENKINIKRRMNIFDFVGDKIKKEDIILLHGGGNFGDLYPAHQKFREFIVESFPENRIVILPQSIHYKEERNLLKTASIFNAHKDLHVFLRDNISINIAREYFDCNIYLLPDMAHQLWSIGNSSIRKLGKGKLGIMRMDGEVKQQESIKKEDYDYITDWPKLLNKWNYLVIKTLRSMAKLSVRFKFINIYVFWSWYKDRLINKAIKLYSKYEEVETSRLHGFILACLMDKKVFLHDNSYGKNSRYFDAHYLKKDYVNKVDKKVL